MKANSIWPNHDYAYIAYKRRDQRFATDMKRVKVIRVFARKELGHAKDTTYAEVNVLNWDGTLQDRSPQITIRVRWIVDFWDDVVAENAETIQRMLEREKREKEAEEQRKQVREKRKERELLLESELRIKGLQVFKVDDYSKFVMIPLKEARRWLNLDPETGDKIERPVTIINL